MIRDEQQLNPSKYLNWTQVAPRTRKIDPRDRRHIEIIEGQEEVTFDTQKTRVTTRKTQKTGLSYCRPNRDYTKKTKWSEAMNKEIYLLYMRAKPQEKGYQKRLKDLWDENYPELDQMNGKQLAQQVRNFKTKKLLSEGVIQLLEQSLNRSPEQNGE